MAPSNAQRVYLDGRRKQLIAQRARLDDAIQLYSARAAALMEQGAPLEVIGHVRLLAQTAEDLRQELAQVIQAIDAELRAITVLDVHRTQLAARRAALVDQLDTHEGMVQVYRQKARACQLDAEEADAAPRLHWAAVRLHSICDQLRAAIKAIEGEIADEAL
jgi:LPS O-antigen subunit length determinant protein (WzzB/FepE family)